MKKNLIYDESKNYVTEKDIALDTIIKDMFNRTLSMFKWDGLPDSIPQQFLEMYLLKNGFAFITKENDKLYCFNGGIGGEHDEYDQPTQVIVANPYLKLNKSYTFKDDTDGCICYNNLLKTSIFPLFNTYGNLLVENHITMRLANILLRNVMTISASDEKTKKSADSFMSKLEQGETSVIGESAFFDGVKSISQSNNANYMEQFVEYEMFLKSIWLQDIGINSNYNLQRSYIGKNEIDLNDDNLRPLVDNMLSCRVDFCKRLNNKYGLNVSVDFDSIWKTKKLANETELENYSTTESEENPLNVDGELQTNVIDNGSLENEKDKINTEEQNENQEECKTSESDGVKENEEEEITDTESENQHEENTDTESENQHEENTDTESENQQDENKKSNDESSNNENDYNEKKDNDKNN